MRLFSLSKLLLALLPNCKFKLSWDWFAPSTRVSALVLVPVCAIAASTILIWSWACTMLRTLLLLPSMWRPPSLGECPFQPMILVSCSLRWACYLVMITTLRSLGTRSMTLTSILCSPMDWSWMEETKLFFFTHLLLPLCPVQAWMESCCPLLLVLPTGSTITLPKAGSSGNDGQINLWTIL